jgi:hypothetical protein
MTMRIVASTTRGRRPSRQWKDIIIRTKEVDGPQNCTQKNGEKVRVRRAKLQVRQRHLVARREGSPDFKKKEKR